MRRSLPGWWRDLPVARTAGWCHGWTTAAGPDFHSPATSPAQARAVRELLAVSGLEAASWTEQAHGGAVLRARTAGCLGAADAIWTDRPGLGLVMRSADCPLILVTGPTAAGGSLFGIAHASWRSTVQRITAALLAEMLAAGLRPDRARAVICPSAGPCCYEVGPEVASAATSGLGETAAQWFSGPESRRTFDLWRANTAQLEAAGLAGQRIHPAGVCTICSGGRYHSFRRDGTRAGRFAALSGGL